MWNEIQKRPLVRPLFLWVMGILLYVHLPVAPLLVGLAMFCFLLLVVLGVSAVGGGVLRYDTRWMWGAVMSVLVVTLSVGVCLSAYKLAATEQVVERPLLERAERVRLALVERFDRLSLTEGEKSVLATLTLGHRQALDRDMRERFSLAGVSHILAVSGFHVAVVCGFLSLLCRFPQRWALGRWVRYALLLCGTWGFAFVTGLAPSAVRAALMLTLYLTGRQLRRHTDGFNTLAAAAFLMLAYNPFYLFDIGFQLSYLAVFSILYLMPRLRRFVPVRNPLLAAPWKWVLVALAAQAGTTLLCFYYFGRFSLVFLFTNPPVTLLATLLLPCALLWLCYPVGWMGQGWITTAVEGLTHAMTRLVGLFGELPWASVSVSFGLAETLGGYLFLLLLLIYMRLREPKVLLCALVLLLLLIVREFII